MKFCKLDVKFLAAVTLSLTWVVIASASPAVATVDNGWTQLGFSGQMVTAVVIDPTNPARLYAAVSGQGVYTSTNGGQTWVLASTGLTDTQVSALAVSPISPTLLFAGTANTCVYKSTDRGATWTDLGDCSLIWNNNIVEGFAFDRAAPDTVFQADYTGVIQSPDGGQTWASSTLPQYGQLGYRVVTHPVSPTVVFATNYDHIYRTGNSGVSWATRDSGLNHGGPVVSVAVAPSAPNVLYAGIGDQGVYKSLDDGEHWANAGLALSMIGPDHLAIDPTDANIVLASTGVYTSATGSNLYLTLNGGANWVPLNTGFGDPLVYSLAISPTNPRVIYVGTINGLFAKTLKYNRVYLPLIGRAFTH